MSHQDGGYRSGYALSERVARRGPSHQSQRGHAGPDLQGETHSLLRTPLFGSAVPRRQRTASVKRPSGCWHEVARRMRQRHAAAVNNNPGRSFGQPMQQSTDTQVDTEQEHEVAEALFDLANMFARPAAPEPSRKPTLSGQHNTTRVNGSYGRMHRARDQEQHSGSPKRHITMPDREAKRLHSRDWRVKPEPSAHSAQQQHEAGPSEASLGANVTTPRAVKAAQHPAAPGPGLLGSGSSAPVSLGLGAFHPGVPPGLPAHFRNNGQNQNQSMANSDSHSGQWGSAAGQPPSYRPNTREAADNGTFSGAFSKPSEANPPPRPKSMRRSANHVYIAHMIVEWQHQMRDLRRQKQAQQPAPNLNYPSSMSYPPADSSLQRSQSGNAAASAVPRQSSPTVPVKQEQREPAVPAQQRNSAPQPSTAPFSYPPPFNLPLMRPPTSQHVPGPRDSSGNIIPPEQYYKNMLGPQKFEELQPRLPLLQPGATWPMGPPGAPSPFVSTPLMLSPQQQAAFAAQMQMWGSAPHTLPGLAGFPPGALTAQLAGSQAMQSGFLRGVRWPDGKGTATIQELPVTSSASPVVSEPKQLNSKPVKQEEPKQEPGGPPASGISADALNRLIAMGGPAGLLDSHNLAQFGVPEHVLQAIKPHGQHNQHSQDGRPTH